MTSAYQGLLKVTLGQTKGFTLKIVGREHQETLRTTKQRMAGLLPFVELAVDELNRLGHAGACFFLQVHDEAPPVTCFHFDGILSTASPERDLLIPDPYAIGSNGFNKLRKSFEENRLPPWSERLPIAVWRGATTGTRDLTPFNLIHNLRYKLCSLGKDLSPLLDARFTAVVQCRNINNTKDVHDILLNQNLLSPRLSPLYMALHRWIIDIDGNVCSWGLLWKLLSGSCVIRISSKRVQWYYHRLKPWVHFVPVSADLNDLDTVLAWCKTNNEQCADIAHRGRALALQVTADMEADQRNAISVYAKNWLQNKSGKNAKLRLTHPETSTTF